jgi:putative exosortase-associated protein (TIGR04073 family)
MRFLKVCVLLVSVVFLGPLAFAEETAGDYMYGIGTKFGRGLENVVTSLAEIPCTVHSDIKDQGGSGVFTGFGKGALFMLRRMLVGVTEVGTFFIPMERTIPRVCHETQP